MRVLMIILLSLSYWGLTAEATEGERRSKRQIPSNIKQGCTTTGYEKRIRELCEDKLEEVCKTVQEVEIKKEIITKCDTRLEQQCNSTIRQVPREFCVERNRTECYEDFITVPEITFTSECENIVQHVCEEHYKVPVPAYRYPNPAIRSLPRRVKRQAIDKHRLFLQLKNALKILPPPHIHHQELPAPPGCRSLVTQKCRKVPVHKTRKVRKELCQRVPGVKCHLQLVDMEEPLCKTVPIEECQDELKETPFLVEIEECEDVPMLVCTEVEEEVPIQVCTSIDIRRDVIVSSKGRTRVVTDTTLLRGAEVVGRLPDVTEDEEDEEEDRSGRALKQFTSEPAKLNILRSKIFGGGRRRERTKGRSTDERAKRILKRLLATYSRK